MTIINSILVFVCALNYEMTLHFQRHGRAKVIVEFERMKNNIVYDFHYGNVDREIPNGCPSRSLLF